MKKILGLLAVTALVATTSASVVACGPKNEDSEAVKLQKNVTKYISEGTDRWDQTNTDDQIIEDVYKEFIKDDVVKDGDPLTQKSLILVVTAHVDSSTYANEDITKTFDVFIYTTKLDVGNAYIKDEASKLSTTSSVILKDKTDWKDITLDKNYLFLKTSESKTDQFTITNMEFLEDVVVVSSDENIVIASQPGKDGIVILKAINLGNAEIIVKASNGIEDKVVDVIVGFS
ncbi:lipoprotein [Spiroplasma sp. BIUS-1]|uniref:lipoprotein n=1 Tax=Spiroplasma sp. BIUS-1 TaxID=216964 RepID=UPI001397EA4C|nr:lipoprotein [Spiroplasma sp. BIUS-1]QHX36773.1 hypothetical protein SBIUS_v1c05200 [Spiroplasma sp. BIUS-1]